MDREFYSGIFFYEEIMGKRNMRVFDIYSFNVANKTKIKDTKNYIDKMLEDIVCRIHSNIRSAKMIIITP